LSKFRLFLLRVFIMVPMALGALCARVKLSAIFTSIAGRYGGGVFRNWKGLTVLGVLPDSVSNPQTVEQVKARGLLACTTKKWKPLSVIVKDAWATVAAYLTEQWDNFENEVGTHTVIRTPRGPYTALGAMVSVHALLGSCDAWDCEDAVTSAPSSVTAPSMIMDCGVTGTTAGLVVTWTDPSEWGANGTAGYVRIWAKSEDGVFFAQMNAFVAAAAETYTITALTPVGGGGPVPLRPGLYFVQVDAINAEGLRNAPSNVFRFVAADPI